MNYHSRPEKKVQWSPQQADFIRWAETGRGSCVLEAVAGAGKTTTIIEAAERMGGNSIILAYNTKIAKEIDEKLKAKGIDFRTVEAKTVHSVGFRAYRKAFQDVEKPTEYKVPDIIDRMIASGALPSTLQGYEQVIARIVSYAKNMAIGARGMPEIGRVKAYQHIIDHYDVSIDVEDERDYDRREKDIIAASMLVLEESNKITKIIDFDDMIYLPLVLNLQMFPFKNVFVDEAQDTNPARRLMVRALLRRGGRVIAVGDSRQAIYGFTGADSNALDLIGEEFQAKRMPLTVTFRCPKAVVAFARQWVSHITAADSAPEGSVSEISLDEFLEIANGLSGESAVLCRNTKPLVSLALKLIRARIACRVEGRDIGTNLKALATRWKAIKTLTALEERLDAYFEKEKAKLKEKREDQKVQALEDRVETLKVLSADLRAAGKDRVDDLTAFIDSIFSDNVSGVLTLSTIHKSKGREWPLVYFLDRQGTLPSFYARQPWQLKQEDNLCYVAATRAQSELIEIIVPPKAKATTQNETEK